MPSVFWTSISLSILFTVSSKSLASFIPKTIPPYISSPLLMNPYAFCKKFTPLFFGLSKTLLNTLSSSRNSSNIAKSFHCLNSALSARLFKSALKTIAASFGIFAMRRLLFDIPRYQNNAARPRTREVPPIINPNFTDFFIMNQI